jgi:septum site-determining protein MinC
LSHRQQPRKVLYILKRAIRLLNRTDIENLMGPMQKVTSPLNLKASLHPFTLLDLHSLDLEVIEADLAKRLQQAPQLLKNAPIVIQMPNQPVDLDWAEQLIDRLRGLGFIPVGLRIEDQHNQLAEHLKLPIFAETASRKAQNIGGKVDAPVTSNAYTCKMVKNVRSGQQLVNPDGDVVVMGNVGQGAEVLAKGSIHIHGSLSGRALAGIAGDLTARISCAKMQAELVALGGQYLVSEKIPQEHWQKPCYISLSDDHLNIESI